MGRKKRQLSDYGSEEDAEDDVEEIESDDAEDAATFRLGEQACPQGPPLPEGHSCHFRSSRL